jgi:hypothetical protein
MQSNLGLAQGPGQYNLTVHNGLPSENIYYMLEDKHGYLWLATPRGVVQYNGYEAKVYGFDAGLSNDDVWELYEDRNGRIWTSSITNELGYIQNNTYHKALLFNNNKTIYPRYMMPYKEGILFYSTYVTKGGAVCFERNDTIYTYGLDGYVLQLMMPIAYDKIAVVCRDSIYHVNFDGSSISIKYIGFIRGKRFINTADPFVNFGDYIMSYKPNGHLLAIYNIDRCEYKEIDLDSFSHTTEEIKLLSTKIERRSYFDIVTGKNVIKIDSNLRCSEVMPINELVHDMHIDGRKIVSVMEDDFWGTCTATSDRGVFFDIGDTAHFKIKHDIDWSDYRYIGSTAGEEAVWWNKQTGSLAMIDTGERVTYPEGSFEHVEKLVPYNNDSSFLLANGFINVFNNSSRKVVGRYTGYDTLSYYESPNNIAPKSASDFYALSKRYGLYHYKWQDNKGVSTYLDNDRYSGIFYDRYEDVVWAYNNKKILLLYKGKRVIVTADAMGAFGIRKVEQILTDRYGNIFIKGFDKLFMLNYHSPAVKLLFSNCRLTGVRMELQGPKMVLAGPFGVLFDIVNGPMSVAKPVIYHNVKDIYYSSVYDTYTSGKNVFLNTDKGFYKVEEPSDSELSYAGVDPYINQYKLILSYNDSLYNLDGNDTLNVYPDNRNLLLDLIKPTGNGKVRYMYRIEGRGEGFQQMNANELFLTDISPGAYLRLSIVASDESWKSNAKPLYIYVVPYWWQKPEWLRVFWILGIAVLISLVFLVSYITNRIATNRNIKRNLRLKLELNSVYAQLNPHFIFNTLSTALYFIKKEKLPEAYAHISKFSKLLRAYIKFSRNKFITVAEEVANLRNYIELQQARFENKFDYEIVTGEGISETTTYIPSLLVQPFVENAIYHGLLLQEDKGHLSIRFVKKEHNSELVCIVEDNGIGREKAREINRQNKSKPDSYGEILVKDLVNIFNKYEKMNIRISYIDKTDPEHGTIVSITIKNPHFEYKS